MKRLPLIAAILGLAFVLWRAGAEGGRTLVLAALVGALAGVALYHAAFGFTAAWRRMVTEGRGLGLRAQFLLIALTIVVSYPLIGWGGAGAWVQPMNLGMVAGAFIFGVGMQLGGGCGSGTLFTVGGGSTRMVITLAFFILGTLIGVWHLSATPQFWRALPSAGRFSTIEAWGPLGALAVTLVVLGLLAWATVAVERRIHGSLETPRATRSLLTGPWSPWAGAVALAAVGILTFLVLDRPWGITFAFGLWGANIGEGLGFSREAGLLAPWGDWAFDNAVIFRDGTSVMDFGIIFGAMAAASLAGRFAPVWRIPAKDIATAVAGGLLMGYGARLAYGCNIGGYLGGVVSGSLHGWVWAAAAFAGSSLVARLRMPRPPAGQPVRA